MRDRFLAAANGERTDQPPVWMMRQAGRYLPEYREIRETHSFLEAISTPEIAVEISLQPWERFEPDGVVMYSDILTALEPLGLSYHLESGVGPVIENPVESPADVERPRFNIESTIDYVGTVLKQLQEHLAGAAAVIGFVGGPFTLAAYAIEGQPSKSYMTVRQFLSRHPDAFAVLLEQFTAVLEDFVQYQADHGADVIQLFDTYAGLLPPQVYREVLLPCHQQVIAAAPVPTIIFARNMGGRLDLLEESGADVISLDWTVDMSDSRDHLGDRPVQGNLDPATLFASPDVIQRRTREVLEAAGDTGHILNLGHGIDKATPIEGVEAFFQAARSAN